MSTLEERLCHVCGKAQEDAHLERCMVCGKWFCVDCAFKQTGRRFCSPGCGRDFFWGDSEDEDDTTKIKRDPES
jgi:hypothetical protein